VGRPATPMSPVPAAEELLEFGSFDFDGAAAFCGISRSEINKAVQRGELKSFRHKGGKKGLIPRRALIRWQAAMYAAQNPECQR
jgi:hypothetical protein